MHPQSNRNAKKDRRDEKPPLLSRRPVLSVYTQIQTGQEKISRYDLIKGFRTKVDEFVPKCACQPANYSGRRASNLITPRKPEPHGGQGNEGENYGDTQQVPLRAFSHPIRRAHDSRKESRKHPRSRACSEFPRDDAISVGHSMSSFLRLENFVRVVHVG